MTGDDSDLLLRWALAEGLPHPAAIPNEFLDRLAQQEAGLDVGDEAAASAIVHWATELAKRCEPDGEVSEEDVVDYVRVVVVQVALERLRRNGLVTIQWSEEGFACSEQDLPISMGGHPGAIGDDD